MIIGTRGSELALKQTEIAVNKLGLKDYTVKVIKTKGDAVKKPLQEIGIAVFTKELDNALLSGEIDIALHSLKDIPVEGFDEKLEIVVIERSDSRDCLIGKPGIIGTDSIRRQYEIKNHYNNINFKSLRGNIPTRIKKLENKEYDGIIVANCALDRLGLLVKDKTVFSVKEMVPAAGQGAIAVVKRKKDKFGFLKKGTLHSCCMLEREFIKDLGGCKKPVGAYCDYHGGGFRLIGLGYKHDKRILANFSGDEEEIIGKIRKWKEKYIL
jgi:hydroxymethylbilane synthase